MTTFKQRVTSAARNLGEKERFMLLESIGRYGSVEQMTPTARKLLQKGESKKSGSRKKKK